MELIKIGDILCKYNFKLSNTNMNKDNTDSVYNEFRNKTLDEIAHDYANQRNCIKEIMKVLYNVQDNDKTNKCYHNFDNMVRKTDPSTGRDRWYYPWE